MGRVWIEVRREDRIISNSDMMAKNRLSLSGESPRSNRNAFFHLLLHVNRNTLLHLSCDVKPEWPNEDDESKRNPPNQIEGRPNCRNGPERKQGIESRRCDETDRTPPPTTTFCRSIARSIAHAWKHAAPHRDVLPLNASSVETLLHNYDNTIEQHQCWTSTTTSFVPRTELSSSTNNTTTTTNAAGHVLVIMEALPPPPYKWMVVLEHESPEAVVWSNGFARRCRNGEIRVSASCLSWNRPTICGSLITLIGWKVGRFDLWCNHHNAVPGVHQTPTRYVSTTHVCGFCGRPSQSC